MINLAGKKDCNDTIRKELNLAGITVSELQFVLPNSEVPTNLFGHIENLWTFQRAWYFWIAKGPGLPLELAEPLHEKFGKEVRVAGHCASLSPRDWYKGFPVPLYHVDTQAGLNALAKALRNV